jgi:glycerol-3-phosphate dehydrogenase
MKSPIESLDDEYDAIIVGGGIVGAGIFRDLSLHGLKCLLIDKKDFSSQTSQSSSKMLHGGIRYLENFDFKLVWEALHEKNLWLKLAPHLTYDKPFILPIYEDSKWPLWMTRIGLALYDFLSGFQNVHHEIIHLDEVKKRLPGIKEKGLKGAGVYHDAIVDDAKLTLEVIFDGLAKKKSHAVNYVELESFENHGKYNDVFVKDTLIPDIKKRITCKELVFALGPFTDKVLSNIKNISWSPVLLPSKGSHLWIKKSSLPLKAPMVLQTSDQRIIFVIPQKSSVLVGTTEERVNGDYFDQIPSPKEIGYLLENINCYFPKYNLTEKDILSSFAGIRPLVRGGKDNLGKTARDAKTYQPYPNVFAIAGGKYTTFRLMGQGISRIIVGRNKLPYNHTLTENDLQYRLKVPAFKRITFDEKLIFSIIQNEYVRTFEDLAYRRLGVFSKNHWYPENCGGAEFEEFFLSMLPKLSKEIIVSREDILNYQKR